MDETDVHAIGCNCTNCMKNWDGRIAEPVTLLAIPALTPTRRMYSGWKLRRFAAAKQLHEQSCIVQSDFLLHT